MSVLIAYYALLRNVLRSGAESRDVYLYGAEEMGIWSMLTLLRNMPPRRESEEACPSQVFRELGKVASNKWRLFWRKQMIWNCLIWISALLGAISSFFFALVMRRCQFRKCYRMLLFRPDLIVFAAQNYWGRKFGDFFGANQQFSPVDVQRAYSLVIRSAYHIVDINNDLAQGRIEDKQVFYELATKHGIPCVPVIDRTQLLEAPEEVEWPIFAKPRKLQWGEGVMKLESKEQQEFRDIVKEGPGSEFFRNFIVQRKLENIPALSKFFPNKAPLCTARITTFISPSNSNTKKATTAAAAAGNENHEQETVDQSYSVKVLESWLRIGASGALADQFENGGSTFALYADTGVVWNGTTTEEMFFGEKPFLEPTLHQAPGAERCITGHKLPYWSDCLRMVKEAHRKLAPHAFTVGWDIVFTESGIQIMEGNLMSMVALHIGMRYGNMALLWPESPLIWLALSDWLRNKQGGLSYTAEAKKKKLERVKVSLQQTIEKTSREKEALKRAVLELKSFDMEGNASSESMRELQVRLMHREGEVVGLSKELAAIKDEILKL